MEQLWHTYTSAKVAELLSVELKIGLSFEEADKRLAKYGKNIFEDKGDHYLLALVTRQFKNPLALVLLIAGIVTFFVKAYLDTTVIFLALFINVAIGMFQEGRTSRAFEKLKESQEKNALVLRDGQKAQISASLLVPGDVIFLKAGNAVPADCRIISATQLFISESALTGEWMDIVKNAKKTVRADAPLAEQSNMAWMGTFVTAGSGMAIVIETGVRTHIGRIAESLRGVEDGNTPLQRNIRRLAYFLSAAIGVIITSLVVVGIVRGDEIGQLLLVAVAIAVAAIPAGLSAAVTVVLALGMETILKKRGLVRNLLAAETLGSTTIILTDKTGTLTEARMSVSAIQSGDALLKDATHAYIKKAPHTLYGKDEQRVLRYAVLASEAFVEQRAGADGSFTVRGNPVERTIIRAGVENGMYQEQLFTEDRRIDFLPFESKRRFSASLHQRKGVKTNRMAVVGAPEIIIEHATSFWGMGHLHRMSEQARQRLRNFQEHTSKRGARMVAVAYKNTNARKLEDEIGVQESVTLHNLVFVGLISLTDPIRADVKESIARARDAGVRVIMVTGDFPATASAVADDVGITQGGMPPLLGDDTEKLTDNQLYEKLKTVNILARVLPEQKLRIARVLKSKEEVVAMTGDGVNDAPALRSADIGVSLGSGTDVAKEASDLVLLDDGFDIIVHAIEEGRRIVDNLKKIIAYLLSTGFTEIFVVGGALIAGAPLPILPAQILWINIIEEGFMNFSFAFEPKEGDVMKRDPRLSRGIVLTSSVKKLIFIIALVTGVFLIALYFMLLSLKLPIEEIRTIMFIALSVDSIFFSFSLKNLHAPLWRINLFSNRYLVFALTSSVLVLFAALLLTPLRTLLSLTSFSVLNFVFLLGLGAFNLVLIEVVKFFVFKKERERYTIET